MYIQDFFRYMYLNCHIETCITLRHAELCTNTKCELQKCMYMQITGNA